MSDLKEVQLDFIGLSIVMPITDQDGDVVDISAATVKTISLKKPDATITNYAAEFYTDGTDGLLKYETVQGDLDTKGIWEAQASVTHPLYTGNTTTRKFKVVRNLSC